MRGGVIAFVAWRRASLAAHHKRMAHENIGGIGAWRHGAAKRKHGENSAIMLSGDIAAAKRMKSENGGGEQWRRWRRSKSWLLCGSIEAAAKLKTGAARLAARLSSVCGERIWRHQQAWQSIRRSGASAMRGENNQLSRGDRQKRPESACRISVALAACANRKRRKMKHGAIFLRRRRQSKAAAKNMGG